MRRRHVLIGKAQDVLDLCRTKRIDGLRVVADNGDTVAVRLECPQDLRLHEIRILVLVDQHMIEPGTDFLRELLVGYEVIPVQQQVIVVQRLALLLAHDVVAKQFTQFGLPVDTPGVGLIKDIGQRLLRIHAT